jgi:hypothetical protein
MHFGFTGLNRRGDSVVQQTNLIDSSFGRSSIVSGFDAAQLHCQSWYSYGAEKANSDDFVHCKHMYK